NRDGPSGSAGPVAGSRSPGAGKPVAEAGGGTTAGPGGAVRTGDSWDRAPTPISNTAVSAAKDGTGTRMGNLVAGKHANGGGAISADLPRCQCGPPRQNRGGAGSGGAGVQAPEHDVERGKGVGPPAAAASLGEELTHQFPLPVG